MAFSGESFQKVRNILNERRALAAEKADLRLNEAYSKLPELKEIDRLFSEIGSKTVEAVTLGGSKEETDAAIKELEKESKRLWQARKDCLSKAGYPEDYTDAKYVCEKCKDTGYDGIKMCECMRRELVKIGYKNSGLGALLEKQRFDNFSLDYYSGDERLMMEQNLCICKNYAECFGKGDSYSMIFIGDTGLGKTHLSTSVAAAVINKGYDVAYETAQNLMAAFSAERFGKNHTEHPYGTDRYFSCDLLIIDDIGTEEINQFSVSCIYNLINTRGNKGLPTIINTNLNRNEIREKYSDRIASRIFGEFIVLCFTGKDIRMQKLMEK